MKIYLKSFIVFMLVFISLVVIAGQNEENMLIKGGFMGEIAFPHNLHENTADNCQKCHAIFPKKKGIIQDFKNNNKIKKKHVMNELCISCHKTKNNAGPTMCNGCHKMILNFLPSGCCIFF